MKAALYCLAALAALSCRPQPPEGQPLELLSRPGELEFRSDAVSLRSLVVAGELAPRAWALETADGQGTAAWMRREQATLDVAFFGAGEKQLRLRAASHADVPAGAEMVVALNGTPVGTLALAPEPREATWTVPASLPRAGANELRLDVRGSRNHRPAVVLDLEIRGGPARPGTAAAGLDGSAAWLPPGSSVSTYLPGPVGGATLAVEARPGPAGAGRLELRVFARSGARTIATVDVASAASARGEVVVEAEDVARLELASVGPHGVVVTRATLWRTPPPVAAPVTLPGRPNVIVYLVDALRADHLGAYGSRRPTSPRFDAFARDGVVFEDASSASSWTRPSVASIFTGLGPLAHDVGGVSSVLVPDIVTLAEAFKAAGYQTGAWVSNGIVHPDLGFAQGFDTWNDPPLGIRSAPATRVLERATDWMARARRPFFLYVHTLEPHGPYEPEPRFWAPFRPPDEPGRRAPDVKRWMFTSPEDLAFVRSAYEGEVLQSDDAFGRFLDVLDAAGRRQDTIVLFTADHGEEFFDHGGRGHGNTLYQEVLHIPLAVRVPGGVAGRRDRGPVQQQDLMPTLLTLAGVPVPSGVEGRDLSGRFAGRAEGHEAVSRLSHLRYDKANKMAVRHGRFKLVLNNEPDAARRHELYDLAADPREQRDVQGRHPEVLGFLALEARRIAALQGTLARLVRAGAQAELSAEQREELRALGYVN